MTHSIFSRLMILALYLFTAAAIFEILTKGVR